MGKNPEKSYSRTSERDLIHNKKLLIIYDAMYENQPDFEDFEGLKWYPYNERRKDIKEYNKKLDRIFYSDYEKGQSGQVTEKDEWAVSAEAVLTYILNDEKLLPMNSTYAHVASDYDDKCHGTDVVFVLDEDNEEERATFSIDIATGTNAKNIRNKFAESAKAHRDVAPWTADIKLCWHNEDRWKALGVPHFIIGLDPRGLLDATNNIAIKDELIAGREPDPITDYKILCEILFQAILQEKLINEHSRNKSTLNRLKSLQKLQRALYNRIDALTDNPNIENLAERKAYKQTKSQEFEDLAKNDRTFGLIVDITLRQIRQIDQKKVIGKTALKPDE